MNGIVRDSNSTTDTADHRHSASADTAARPDGQRGNRPVALWLLACCGMVVVMMLIGAATRLTESGLSMVEWRPLIGALPPLGEAEWQRIFGLYQKTSEYRLENAGMTLADFKTIFWWEYIHRLWGRLIGVVFAVPMLWFMLRRRVRGRLAFILFGLFLLGAAQGVIGWWMVKSGFADRSDVSQYRLAIHLGMAFLILGCLLWVALGLLSGAPQSQPVTPGIRRGAVILLALITVTVLSGGLVAGLNAGFAYNDWPFMNGQLVPREITDLVPLWLNLFENVATVQFDHRLLAYLTAAGVLLLWLAALRNRIGGALRRPLDLLLVMVVAQIALGVFTLIQVVPIGLAVLHQAGAIAVFCLAVWNAHRLCRRTTV
jgi:cytochrome c oxidase assembly protein subunit 15